MRRWCNTVYSWLVENLDESGLSKLERELNAPLPGETAADVERERERGQTAPVDRAPRSRGTTALMASFGKQGRGA